MSPAGLAPFPGTASGCYLHPSVTSPPSCVPFDPGPLRPFFANGGLTWTPLFGHDAVSSIGGHCSGGVRPERPLRRHRRSVVCVSFRPMPSTGHRSDDLRPYVYKTADYGNSWTKITAGIPENNFVHAVREEPRKKGLPSSLPDVMLSFQIVPILCRTSRSFG
jgi:hypothetical protein